MLKVKKFRLLAMATGLCLRPLVAAEEAEVLSLEEAPPICVLPTQLMPIYEQEQPDDSDVEGDTAEPDEVVTTQQPAVAAYRPCMADEAHRRTCAAR